MIVFLTKIRYTINIDTKYLHEVQKIIRIRYTSDMYYERRERWEKNLM